MSVGKIGVLKSPTFIMLGLICDFISNNILMKLVINLTLYAKIPTQEHKETVKTRTTWLLQKLYQSQSNGAPIKVN